MSGFVSCVGPGAGWCGVFGRGCSVGVGCAWGWGGVWGWAGGVGGPVRVGGCVGGCRPGGVVIVCGGLFDLVCLAGCGVGRVRHGIREV